MEVSVQNLIDAIRKNGLIKIQGNYYHFDKTGPVNKYEAVNDTDDHDTVIGGCAYGQAAINLGVEASNLDSASGLNTGIAIYDDHLHRRTLNDYIRHLNDNTDMSLAEIADKLEEVLTDEQRFISFYV